MSTDLCGTKLLEKHPPAKLKLILYHFFVKMHIFVKISEFSGKGRPALGEHKAKVLSQHLFFMGGGVGRGGYLVRFLFFNFVVFR